MPDNIPIRDKRKINPNTKKPIDPRKDLKSMKADPYMIKNIYNTARDYGIDPNLMLAVGLQESNLGKTDERNPFRVNSLYHGIDEDPMRQGAAIFRDSYNKYKNKSEAHRIQAYNGLTAKTKANPAYGNSVISLRDSVIKQSPELQGYLTQLDSAYNAYNKPMKKRPQTNKEKLNPFQQAIFGMTGQIFGEGGSVQDSTALYNRSQAVLDSLTKSGWKKGQMWSTSDPDAFRRAKIFPGFGQNSDGTYSVPVDSQAITSPTGVYHPNIMPIGRQEINNGGYKNYIPVYKKPSTYGEGGAIKPYVTNDPNDYRIQAYKDSLDAYNYGNVTQANEKSKVLRNITNYSPTNSQGSIASAFGNFFNSGQIRPKYSEVKTDGKWDSYKGKSGNIDPIGTNYYGDIDYNTDYNFLNKKNKNLSQESKDNSPFFSSAPEFKKPVQPVIYQKPTVKETVKPVSRAKPKTVAKPVQSTPVATPQVTPEAQTQINTGGQNNVTLGISSPDSSTGKRLYRLGNKNITEQQFNQYKSLGKHKVVEYGLGGEIGGILGGIAGNMLIPGVGGMIGSQLGSVLGKGAQNMFAQGGMSGLTPINVEGHNVNSISMARAKKGELLVNNGQMIKNYISRPPHPEKGQNPLGDDLVQPGSIIIPKNRSQEYLNAGRALRKQIEASVVSQQVAREGNMMRKGGQAGRSKRLPGSMAKDYFDREYPYAPSLNPNVGYTQVETGGNDYMLGDAYRNGRAGVPASFNNTSTILPVQAELKMLNSPENHREKDKVLMSPMTPRNPFNSGYDQNLRTQRAGVPASFNNMSPMTPRNPFSTGYNQNLRTQMSNQDQVTDPGQGDSGEEGKPPMSPFDKLNLAQLGLNAVPAIGDILDMTAKVQTPQFGRLQNVNPNLIDPNTGQSQINQGYRSGYNSLRDSGVYSIKSNRNLVADRMQRSGDQALNIANQNAQIKNQFIGMNTDINKYNLDMQNQVELYRMQGQAKRREARRNLLDRAPYAVSQYMQNGLYAKMLGI